MGTGKALECYLIILLSVIKLDASVAGSKHSGRAERGGQDVTVAGPCTVPKCSDPIAQRSLPLLLRRSPRECHLVLRLKCT